MDIFEQVDNVIKKMESREKNNRTSRLYEEALILEEMSKRYRQYLENHQWEKAHECLENISRIVVAILAE